MPILHGKSLVIQILRDHTSWSSSVISPPISWAYRICLAAECLVALATQADWYFKHRYLLYFRRALKPHGNHPAAIKDSNANLINISFYFEVGSPTACGARLRTSGTRTTSGPLWPNCKSARTKQARPAIGIHRSNRWHCRNCSTGCFPGCMMPDLWYVTLLSALAMYLPQTLRSRWTLRWLKDLFPFHTSFRE